MYNIWLYYLVFKFFLCYQNIFDDTFQVIQFSQNKKISNFMIFSVLYEFINFFIQFFASEKTKKSDLLYFENTVLNSLFYFLYKIKNYQLNIKYPQMTKNIEKQWLFFQITMLNQRLTIKCFKHILSLKTKVIMLYQLF